MTGWRRMRRPLQELQACVNMLLLQDLLRGGPRPVRTFYVSIEGTTARLMLHDAPSVTEARLRKTPKGKAAIAAWEYDLLLRLGPTIHHVVQEYTRTRVLLAFKIRRSPEGRAVLTFKLAPGHIGRERPVVIH